MNAIATLVNLPAPPPAEPPLPERLSDLLDLAVTDARRLDRTYYRLECGEWAANAYDQGRKVCLVSLAGAVMMRSLGAAATLRRYAIGVCLDPEDFAGDALRKLYAVDHLSLGLLCAAAAQLDQAPLRALESLERRVRADMERRESQPREQRAAPWRLREQEDWDAALDWHAGLAAQLRAIGC